MLKLEVNTPRKPIRYPQEQPARSKRVTIGLGIKCSDGIVIASDTQMSIPDSSKFHESKLYPIGLTDDFGWACFSFAGDRELMRTFKDKFLAEIHGRGYVPSVQGTREAIEDVLQQMEREIIYSLDRGGGFSTLCGVAINDELVLLKTSSISVGEVDFFDFVGVGDSQLIRYLSQLFLFEPVTVKSATAIATYLVARAKVFVQGCGGDTNLIQLLPPGRIHDLSDMMPSSEQQVLRSEFFLKQFIRDLIDSSKTEEERRISLKRFSDSFDN